MQRRGGVFAVDADAGLVGVETLFLVCAREARNRVAEIIIDDCAMSSRLL